MVYEKQKNNTMRRISRQPAVEEAYRQSRAKKQAVHGDALPCPLCDEIGDRVVVEELETMIVVGNDFPYAIFGDRVVLEHLLLSPKRHVNSFNEFTEKEMKDYWLAYQRYSLAGFTSLTQAADSAHRSVPDHLHTHLIRCE